LKTQLKSKGKWLGTRGPELTETVFFRAFGDFSILKSQLKSMGKMAESKGTQIGKNPGFSVFPF
jgi:hypothetical protein